MEHYPVLGAEATGALDIQPEGVYWDATTGLGGHTAMIAERATQGRVIASDRDPESIERSRQTTAEWSERITFVHARFSELSAVRQRLALPTVRGLLADLGVSRYQLTDADRGFSLMRESELDMRMDRSRGETAADIVNYSAEKALADLIYQLGEERRARKIARAIVRARPIRSTLHLAKVIEQAAPRTGRLHPATQTFMALRIAVNDEQEELDAFLAAIPSLVAPGGRAAVISFMSLEDRKVKHAFQALARAGSARILTKHVITPSDREVAENPASRSAKLRVLEFLG